MEKIVSNASLWDVRNVSVKSYTLVLNSKNLQYVRVLGASHTMVSSILYHITLETVDATKPKIYHAVVWLQILKNFMELLAWKPVNDRLSVLGVKSGDLKLHEAVMFYMNDVQRDRFLN